MSGRLDNVLFDVPFSGLIPGAKGAVLDVLLRTGKPMTGRHVASMVGAKHSLWAVQSALKELVAIGLVVAETYGRSTVHQLNGQHAFVPPLREFARPLEVLSRVVQEANQGAQAVILFGSLARGEAGPASDVDLAVLAPEGWNGALALQDAVWERIGNACDVLVFTVDDFLAKVGIEPVVDDIVRDGVPLVGEMPKLRKAR
ncbi:MAG: nucleotidyltransferase domain-containing protein [Propionibacteriaceae bacterium]|nr:nucleotidyltransferase domain-containing protein [Propionibacteriaceae bacterium]